MVIPLLAIHRSAREAIRAATDAISLGIEFIPQFILTSRNLCEVHTPLTRHSLLFFCLARLNVSLAKTLHVSFVSLAINSIFKSQVTLARDSNFILACVQFGAKTSA